MQQRHFNRITLPLSTDYNEMAQLIPAGVLILNFLIIHKKFYFLSTFCKNTVVSLVRKVFSKLYLYVNSKEIIQLKEYLI